MPTPGERRLLDDVLRDEAHRAWVEALRRRCVREMQGGALPERALLEDVLADDDYEAFRRGLGASLRARVAPRLRWRWGRVAAVAATLLAAFVLFRPEREPRAPAPHRVVVASAAPRPRYAVTPRTMPRVSTRRARRVYTSRALVLTDADLLALVPRAGLVRRGSRWHLHFLYRADEARTVVGVDPR